MAGIQIKVAQADRIKMYEKKLRKFCHQGGFDDGKRCTFIYWCPRMCLKGCGRFLGLDTAMAWEMALILGELYSRIMFYTGNKDQVEIRDDELGGAKSLVLALKQHRSAHADLYTLMDRAYGYLYYLKKGHRR